MGALQGAALQAAEPRHARVVIRNDYGGPIDAQVQRIAAMRAAGQSVAVPSGHCMSACTLYLGLPGSCVGPTAVFGFHGPASHIAGIGLSQDEFERYSQLMAGYYPPALRQWFLQTARYRTQSYYAVTGAELHRLGVPLCG